MDEGVQPKPCDSHLYLLPSVKAITDYKQLQTSEMERGAANALFNKNENSKAIIHFDTSGHSLMDGESPSIILSLTDGLEYRFRPLFLHVLPMALNISADENIEPVCLWEKVDAVMTDAATKNLGIKETVPTTLGSSYL